MRAKEAQMAHMQQSEVKELGNTLAAKVKRAAIMEKHKLESEKFRLLTTKFANRI